MQCIITLYLIDTVWSLDPCQWCWFIDCWTVNGKHEELGKRCHTELLCAVCTVASEGQNVGGRSAAVLLCPRLGELGPRAHLTMSPVPRPTSVPSGILIYPAVWLQQTCLFGRAGCHLTQCGRGRSTDRGQGLPPCQVSSWSIQPFGHNTLTSQTDRTDRQGQTDRQRSDSMTREFQFWRLKIPTPALKIPENSRFQKTLHFCIFKYIGLVLAL